MQRRQFLMTSLLVSPVMALARIPFTSTAKTITGEPFIVDAGKSRFGEVVKFLGVHPNDLKISSKDTGGQLSVFEYTGLGKVGPMLHIHFEQDEIFMVMEGEYRFVAGKETHVLHAGQTIFLPRGIPHTWICLLYTSRCV